MVEYIVLVLALSTGLVDEFQFLQSLECRKGGAPRPTAAEEAPPSRAGSEPGPARMGRRRRVLHPLGSRAGSHGLRALQGLYREYGKIWKTKKQMRFMNSFVA